MYKEGKIESKKSSFGRSLELAEKTNRMPSFVSPDALHLDKRKREINSPLKGAKLTPESNLERKHANDSLNPKG